MTRRIWVGLSPALAVVVAACASWESDAASAGERTFAHHFIKEADGTVVGTDAYSAGDVAEDGWESIREDEVSGREAVCGSSLAFAVIVDEVCIDVALGIPQSVERDGASGGVVKVRAPEDDDFAPPNEPWDAADADD